SWSSSPVRTRRPIEGEMDAWRYQGGDGRSPNEQRSRELRAEPLTLSPPVFSGVLSPSCNPCALWSICAACVDLPTASCATARWRHWSTWWFLAPCASSETGTGAIGNAFQGRRESPFGSEPPLESPVRCRDHPEALVRVTRPRFVFGGARGSKLGARTVPTF